MKVLIACEYSGRVREAFKKAGHDAMSCDLLPSDIPGNHYQGDVLDILHKGWDMMIAHPPCTYLTLAGIHWNNRIPGRKEKTMEALEFIKLLLNAPIKKIAVENPAGVISTYIRKPDQYIQPWQFGHPESKKTGLWLKGLPLLQATKILSPTQFQLNGKNPRWNNQTPTGQNKYGPSVDRWKLRSLTYQGIADAMAQQWGLI
jgi:hypothetical protein